MVNVANVVMVKDTELVNCILILDGEELLRIYPNTFVICQDSGNYSMRHKMADLFFAYSDSKHPKRSRWFYKDKCEWQNKPDSAGIWELNETKPDGSLIIIPCEVKHGKRGLEIFIFKEWVPVEDFYSVYEVKWRKIK